MKESEILDRCVPCKVCGNAPVYIELTTSEYVFCNSCFLCKSPSTARYDVNFQCHYILDRFYWVHPITHSGRYDGIETIIGNWNKLNEIR